MNYDNGFIIRIDTCSYYYNYSFLTNLYQNWLRNYERLLPTMLIDNIPLQVLSVLITPKF